MQLLCQVLVEISEQEIELLIHGSNNCLICVSTAIVVHITVYIRLHNSIKNAMGTLLTSSPLSPPLLPPHLSLSIWDKQEAAHNFKFTTKIAGCRFLWGYSFLQLIFFFKVLH